jgi:formate dehydrogenase beta subunit
VSRSPLALPRTGAFAWVSQSALRSLEKAVWAATLLLSSDAAWANHSYRELRDCDGLVDRLEHIIGKKIVQSESCFALPTKRSVSELPDGTMSQPTDAPSIHKFGHPGAGRKRAKSTPKGRQIDPVARQAVLELLGDLPRRRDLLIEHLHLIQDRYHQISAAHLAALADEMRLSFAEVFEVATFYAHFDVVKEGDRSIAPLTIRVCDSLTCAMSGAAMLMQQLSTAVGADIRVIRAPCVGRCDHAPVAEVGHHFIDDATTATVLAAVEQGETHAKLPPYIDYQTYVAQGGYGLLGKLRAGAIAVEDVLKAVEAGNLRGLGGAGFPTARKWRAVRGEPGPRIMVVNGDEGEPGTFKDRYFLETDPHRFLEGTLIAAHVIGASDVYLYIRDEYPAARAILAKELAKLSEASVSVHLRRGAGAYICGEESALLESLEGRRGLPRHKPPYPFQVGLFDRPTLINNVETLFWVRDIVEKGAAWWNSQGRNGRFGLRSFSVSGRVKEPGMKLAPAGITVRELIDEFCGGMADGHRFYAYLPGGASGGILPATMAAIPLDFGTLEAYGCFIGSAAVVILSEQDDIKAAALNLMRFFEDESCGQCTPCRVGTQKAAVLMEARQWDQALLSELADAMRDASICGLGQAAPNPVTSIIRYFPHEFSPKEAAE